MNQPKITIVTVVRNAANTIEQTMLSVLNQTYPNIEYIIVDGDSTDGTKEIITNCLLEVERTNVERSRNIKFISEPDKGIYDAMNKGIDLATGEWINFMNAGDWFVDNEVLGKVFGNNSYEDIDVVYGKAIFYSEFLEVVYNPENIETLAIRMPLCHQSAFVKTKLHKETKFNLKYKSSGDYDFFYRCFMSDKMFFEIPEKIAYYEMLKGVSKENYELVKKEDLLIRGEYLSISKRLKIKLSCFHRKIKNIIKNFLPKNVVFKITYKNLQKIYGEQNVFTKKSGDYNYSCK